MVRVVLLLGRSTGGIGTHVGSLTAGLRALGHDVVVVTHPSTAEAFAWDGTQTWWPSPAAPRAAARSLGRLRSLAAASDVVHAHGHQAGLVGLLATRGIPTPLVVSVHNEAAGPGIGLPGLSGRVLGLTGTLVPRAVARAAALVTGASEDLVEAAQRSGARRVELAPVPSPVVPLLLSEPMLSEAERAQSAHALTGSSLPLVLTIARTAPQKNLPVLVAAAARLAHPVQWVVIGSGDAALRAALERDIRTSAAPVRLLGAQRDVGEWVRAATVFALTSDWEARALVVQEAMAAGTPVVVTGVGGLPGLVGDAGRVIPARNPAALAGAVDELLADRQTREELAARGRGRAATWPDEEATARQWARWYASVGAVA